MGYVKMNQRKNLSPNTKKAQLAFSMTEALFVVLLIGLTSVIAFPTYDAFVSKHKDYDISSQIANLLNRTKEQAQRRTRAYKIDIESMNNGAASGLIRISESYKSSCDSIVERPNEVSIVWNEPFGNTVIDNRKSSRTDVGIRGFRMGRIGGFVQQPLTLCVGIDGAFYWLNANKFTPVSGVLQIAIQQFTPESQISGPPRLVDISFGGGASVRLETVN